MKLKTKNLLFAAPLLALGIAVGGLNAVPTFAEETSTNTGSAKAKDCDVTNGIDLSCARPENVQDSLFEGKGSLFKNVVNTMLFLIGVLSVIMLIYGGIRYTISRGDSGEVNNAKNTILYAVVGLIVALLAYAIINWVVGKFSDTSGGSSNNSTN